jgi:branched-chain amino acid transport system substrate-binding protein
MAGAIASPAAWAAAEAAERAGVALLICGASATAITEPPWRHVFRINPPVEEKYAALAAFLDRFDVEDRSVAVLCEQRPEVKALSESWLSAAPTMGLDPLFRVFFTPGLVDYRPELARIRVKRPALMILIADPSDGALMIRQSRQLNLSPSLLLGESAGFARTAFAEAAGGFGEFVCALMPWAPSASNPGARRFTDNYRRRFGQVPGHHAAMAHAAMTALADSARRARTESRRALRDALAGTDLSTVCGRVRFDPRSARPGQNRSSWLLVQWQAGRLETVWPPAKASADPVFPAPQWRSRLR